jgi:AMP-binding enzyme
VTSEVVKGLPSTHGDHYQLNTTTLIRHAVRTYPEQEIVYRSPDGGWDRYYSHRGIYLHAMAEVAAMGIRSDDAVLMIAPMFHAQCWGLPYAAVQAAAKIVLPGRYTAEDPQVLVDAMIAEQVTLANGAPAIFQPMMNYIKSLTAAAQLQLTAGRARRGLVAPPRRVPRPVTRAEACATGLVAACSGR